MLVRIVTFETNLPDTVVSRLFEERAPQYRAVPGLVQKYYASDHPARSIASVYQIAGQPRVRACDVVMALR